MTDWTSRILSILSERGYQPLKPKPLAKKLGVVEDDYPQFRKTLKSLIQEGRIDLGKNNVLRAADQFGSLVGIYKRTNSGHGFVRPSTTEAAPVPDVFIREGKERDAASGDEVLIRITRRATQNHDAAGEVVRVITRATRSFVGTYFERDGQAFVIVDSNVFAHSIAVGDPGAKGAKSQDKVVIDMIRFPTLDERGEGAIVEVLGPLGKPGVDLLTIIRGFGYPKNSRRKQSKKRTRRPTVSAKWPMAVPTSPAIASSPLTRKTPAISTTPSASSSTRKRSIGS